MFKFFAVACWCCWSCEASVVRQGVLFQTRGDLAFSSTTFTLGLVFDMNNLTHKLASLSSFTQDLVAVAERSNATYFSPFFVIEINKIAALINSTIKDVNDFITSFPEKKLRTEQFVLGLTTDNEIDGLVEQVRDQPPPPTGGGGDGDHHVKLSQFVSYLDVTDKQLDRLNEATYLMKLASRIMMSDHVKANVVSDIAMAQTINFLLFAAMHIQSEVAKLLTAIETQEQTRTPSTIFLPPEPFLAVLDTIQNYVLLLHPATTMYISSFYDISNVITKKVGTKFIFLVRIPLKSNDGMFDLYYMTAMWHRQTQWARKLVVEDPYLAVSKDGRLSVSLPNMNTCVQSRTMMVCTPVIGFTVNTGCIMSVYHDNNRSDAICPFVYSLNYEPSFHRVGDGWVVTTPTQLRGTELCDMVSRVIVIPAGISKLMTKNQCQVTGDSFNLPPFITSHETVEISHSHTFPPSLPNPNLIQKALKKLKLQYTDTFTRPQLALLNARLDPHEYFTFKEVLIIVCVVLCFITFDLLVRCWLKLRRLFPREKQHTYEPAKRWGEGGGCVIGYNPPIILNPPPKPTRPIPAVPPVPASPTVIQQPSTLDSDDEEYVEMMRVVV